MALIRLWLCLCVVDDDSQAECAQLFVCAQLLLEWCLLLWLIVWPGPWAGSVLSDNDCMFVTLDVLGHALWSHCHSSLALALATFCVVMIVTERRDDTGLSIVPRKRADAATTQHSVAWRGVYVLLDACLHRARKTVHRLLLYKAQCKAKAGHHNHPIR
jgi:hypothetical protein